MPRSQQNRPAPRDRYPAFAFAAADMLVEAAPDGVITFAAGAFPAWFGAAPEAFLRRRLAGLVAPADQAALAMALAGVGLRGRVAPFTVRLSDPGGTPAVLAVLLMPGPPPRLCVTIGQVPQPAVVAPPGGAADPLVFAREAELALRAGDGARLGLVELEGWAAGRSDLDAADQARLREAVTGLLADCGPGVTVGELAEGRFGIIGGAGLDLGDLAARLRALLGAGPAAGLAQVSETALALTPAGLTPAQAARTLRYAVTRFAAGGSRAARQDGAAAGLAGIIARAEQQAQAMREAIAARRFRLQFQPIVCLADRSVHHYEALLRPVPSERLPAGSTQDFVLFAEMVGLSEELDLAVLAEALAALDDAREAAVAANISGLSMQSPEFRARVGALLAAHPVAEGAPEAPHRLLVELTETAEIEDMAAAAAAIATLRGQGVPVCLDDFGAGGAAFRYLREFGVDYVKIDGLYVRAAARGPRERGFVASMAELAATVGARVVAEMVETEEQARLMQSLGVQYGQGWLFGRPGSLPGARR